MRHCRIRVPGNIWWFPVGSLTINCDIEVRLWCRGKGICEARWDVQLWRRTSRNNRLNLWCHYDILENKETQEVNLSSTMGYLSTFRRNQTCGSYLMNLTLWWKHSGSVAFTLCFMELQKPPADSWGLEESSEDSEEFDHALPLSNTSWCRRRFWKWPTVTATLDRQLVLDEERARFCS